jgi:Tol biopolymer transport system component/tRNA A-37 threonylcarbamoyl transferase component Bud32
MGVVYRARDEQLERDVALKVLSAGSLADEAARKRFRQEALALSQLNHPHICTIYEVGEEENQAYIAMEHVKGSTLNALIPAEGLPAETVIRYGAQIADALAHAHERNLLHRDLKGSNVVITPEGRAKVLDFGLAKQLQDQKLLDATRSQEALTDAGSLVGTVHYLPPEVLRAERADARSDIWAFGVLLYYAVQGELPFQGQSAFEVTSAILRESPPPLSSHVPAGLRAILQRCLSKDPAQRYQTAVEVRAALGVMEDISSGVGTARPAPIPTRRRWPLAAAAAALLAAAAGLWWFLGRVRPPELSGQRLISTFPGSHRTATFSPDGSIIAFLSDAGGAPQVWIKNLVQGDPVQITKFENGAPARPRWSPKNDQIVFARRGLGIWSTPPLGGAPRRLLDAGRNPSFSSDGERLVYERGKEIWVAKADGSDPRRIEGVPERFYSMDSLPAFSPDGRWIAFFHAEVGPHGDLWVIASTGGQARQLTFDTRAAGAPIWTPDGRWILYSSSRAGSRTLWCVPAAGGAPQPLTTGAGEDHDPALSADGKRLLFTNVRTNWLPTLLDPATGKRTELMESRTDLVFPRFSPAGDRIAFFHQAAEGVHIFTFDLEGKDLRQVTQGKQEINTMPTWSGDGAVLYFYQMRPKFSYRSVPVAGGASTEVAPWRWETQHDAQVDPQGRYLVYVRQEGSRAPVTMLRDMQSGQEKSLGWSISDLSWSRDGRTVLGSQRDGGVSACPVQGGECTVWTKGFQPRWSGDGSAIYFLRSAFRPSQPDLWCISLRERRETKIGPIGPFQPIEVHYDVSPRDQVVYSEYREGRHELWLGEVK